MRGNWRVGLFLWVVATRALAGIDIIVGSSSKYLFSVDCAKHLVRLSTPSPDAVGYGMDLSPQGEVFSQTRKRVAQTYVELGRIPASEARKIEDSDDAFPIGAFLYLRILNDTTGKIEGILRLVSGYPHTQTYFNIPTEGISSRAAHVPMYHAYPEAKIRAFLAAKFPNAVELGRLAFGTDVKRSRVLGDMLAMAATLCRQPRSKELPPRYFIAEAVAEALPLMEAFGFERVELPGALAGGRTFIAMKVDDLYERILGNARRVPASQAQAQFPAVFELFSESPRLRSVYLYGFYQQALVAYENRDFAEMVKAVEPLKTQDPDNREYRFLELIAETGNRFDWRKGTGDRNEAIRFLESSESVERYTEQTLPESEYRMTRDLFKGMVHLGADDVTRAREARVWVEKQLLERERLAKEKGMISWVAPPRVHGRMIVENWMRNLYDPQTGKGDANLALGAIEQAKDVPHLALTPELYDYLADVLASVSRPDEAATARTIAQALKELPYSYRALAPALHSLARMGFPCGRKRTSACETSDM